jgi:hypothetical protein
MSALRRLVACGAAVALTGCGGVTAGHAGPPRHDAPRTSSSPTAPAASRAVSVTFERMGGKTGVQQVRRFAAGQPPPAGTGRSQVRAVLDAASVSTLRTLHLPRMPQDLCCDRFTYTIWITWADGKKRVFRTADGLHKPAPLRHLISVLS